MVNRDCRVAATFREAGWSQGVAATLACSLSARASSAYRRARTSHVLACGSHFVRKNRSHQECACASHRAQTAGRGTGRIRVTLRNLLGNSNRPGSRASADNSVTSLSVVLTCSIDVPRTESDRRNVVLTQMGNPVSGFPMYVVWTISGLDADTDAVV